MDNFLNKIKALVKKFEKIVFFIIALILVFIILVVVGSYSLIDNLRVKSQPSLNRGVGASIPSEMSFDSGYAVEMDSTYSKNIMPPITPSPSPNPSTPDIPQDKKIIRNGSLNLLVKDGEDSAKEITTIAERANGFVENISLSEYTEGVKSGYLTVRVPAEKFFEVMQAIKDLAIKVETESVNTNDVTATYVDLEANLKNLKAEELGYQKIMDSAKSVEDILKVSEKLANVRNRIERIEGQLNLLSRQVSMSTINISLTAEKQVKVLGIVWRPLTVLKQGFRDMLQGFVDLVNWVINLVFRLPVLIAKLAIVIILFVAIWKVLGWGRRAIWRG